MIANTSLFSFSAFVGEQQMSKVPDVVKQCVNNVHLGFQMSYSDPQRPTTQHHNTLRKLISTRFEV